MPKENGPSDKVLQDHFGHQFVRLVPHWYVTEHGPNLAQLKFGKESYTFASLNKLNENEQKLLKHMNTFISKMKHTTHVTTPAYSTVMQEEMAATWLKIHNDSIHWYRLMRYLTSMTHRTSENAAISLNLILTDGTGQDRIDSNRIQKAIDSLASSPYTYMKSTHNIEFIEYGEIRTGEVSQDQSFNCPEFLRPLRSIMKEKDILASVTARGDILIMSSAGLLASRRGGQWKLYDTELLTNSVERCLGSRAVASNVFGLMFDLSFRRHGALLVYDPDHKVIKHIVNTDSIISNQNRDMSTVHSWLAPILSTTSLGSPQCLADHRRLLAEIASVDGAVLFDERSVLSFGSIIETGDECGHLGARTTAAKSAFQFGGRPVKISSDGQISIHLQSTYFGDTELYSCDAEIEIL